MNVEAKEQHRGDTHRTVTVTGAGEQQGDGTPAPETREICAIVATCIPDGEGYGYYQEVPCPVVHVHAVSRVSMTRGNWETYKKLVDAAFAEHERRWPAKKEAP